MGLLGEALFLFLGEFRNVSQASPDKPDGACVFLMRGCLGMGKGSFGKVVRGSRETEAFYFMFGVFHDLLQLPVGKLT